MVNGGYVSRRSVFLRWGLCWRFDSSGCNCIRLTLLLLGLLLLRSVLLKLAVVAVIVSLLYSGDILLNRLEALICCKGAPTPRQARANATLGDLSGTDSSLIKSSS